MASLERVVELLEVVEDEIHEIRYVSLQRSVENPQVRLSNDRVISRALQAVIKARRLLVDAA